jgi:hypothetical protein
LFLSLNSDEGGARAPGTPRSYGTYKDVTEERDEDEDEDDHGPELTGGKRPGHRAHYHGSTYTIQKTKPALCM